MTKKELDAVVNEIAREANARPATRRFIRAMVEHMSTMTDRQIATARRKTRALLRARKEAKP